MTKNLKISLEEILYIVFFCLLFFAKGIGLYDGQDAFKIFLVLSVLCLTAKLGIGEYTWPELAKMAVVMGISGLVYLTSGEKGLLLYGFMIIGLKNINLKRLFKIAFWVWSAAFGLLWIISMTHMEHTMYRVVSKLGMEHIFRWSMGYAHPNVLHITYLVWAVLLLYLIGSKINWKTYALLAVGNLLIFIYSISYTGVIIVFLLLAGRLYLQLRGKLCLIEKVLAGLVFPVCIFISLVAPVVLKGRAFELLNKVLNTRLGLARYYLQPQYFSLFGVRLADITTETLTMDNAYVFAFITYGIIPFAVICIAFICLLTYLLINKNYTEVLILLVLSVAGLTEPFLFNTSFKNIGFLFMGILLFKEKNSRKEKTISLFAKANKTFIIDYSWLCEIKNRLLHKIIRNKLIILSGTAAGIVTGVVIFNAMVKLPEGYVVRRSYCEDISEEITVFDENQTQYEDYRYMESFQQGEEIQVFAGDIVSMERFRGNLLGVLAGGIAGGLIAAIAVQIKKEA